MKRINSKKNTVLAIFDPYLAFFSIPQTQMAHIQHGVKIKFAVPLWDRLDRRHCILKKKNRRIT